MCQRIRPRSLQGDNEAKTNSLPVATGRRLRLGFGLVGFVLLS